MTNYINSQFRSSYQFATCTIYLCLHGGDFFWCERWERGLALNTYI